MDRVPRNIENTSAKDPAEFLLFGPAEVFQLFGLARPSLLLMVRIRLVLAWPVLAKLPGPAQVFQLFGLVRPSLPLMVRIRLVFGWPVPAKLMAY